MAYTHLATSSIDNIIIDKSVELVEAIMDIINQYDVVEDPGIQALKTRCELIQDLYRERCVQLVRSCKNYQSGTFIKG